MTIAGPSSCESLPRVKTYICTSTGNPCTKLQIKVVQLHGFPLYLSLQIQHDHKYDGIFAQCNETHDDAVRQLDNVQNMQMTQCISPILSFVPL